MSRKRLAKVLLWAVVAADILVLVYISTERLGGALYSELGYRFFLAIFLIAVTAPLVNIWMGGFYAYSLYFPATMAYLAFGPKVAWVVCMVRAVEAVVEDSFTRRFPPFLRRYFVSVATSILGFGVFHLVFEGLCFRVLGFPLVFPVVSYALTKPEFIMAVALAAELALWTSELVFVGYWYLEGRMETYWGELWNAVKMDQVLELGGAILGMFVYLLCYMSGRFSLALGGVFAAIFAVWSLGQRIATGKSIFANFLRNVFSEVSKAMVEEKSLTGFIRRCMESIAEEKFGDPNLKFGRCFYVGNAGTPEEGWEVKLKVMPQWERGTVVGNPLKGEAIYVVFHTPDADFIFEVEKECMPWVKRFLKKHGDPFMSLLNSIQSFVSKLDELEKYRERIGTQVRYMLMLRRIMISLQRANTIDEIEGIIRGALPSFAENPEDISSIDIWFCREATGKIEAYKTTGETRILTIDELFEWAKGPGFVAVGALPSPVAIIEINSAVPVRWYREAFDLFLDELAAVIKNTVTREELRGRASVDPVTGLFNFTYLMGEIKKLEEQQAAEGIIGPVSIILYDVDGLAKINAKLGEAAGNKVLGAIGEVLRQRSSAIESLVPARIGCDEVALLCRGFTKAKAVDLAESLRREMLTHPGIGDLPEDVKPKLLVGVASYPEDVSDVLELLERAKYEAVKSVGEWEK